MGRDSDATAVVEALAQRVPGNPVAQHLLAATSGREVPAQAPDGYVQHLFDTFADTFDFVLERLDYRAPALIEAALKVELPLPARDLDILDAGCGTGLCGPLLRPWARRLVGVDLSAAMLARARARETFDELHQAELTAFIAGCERAFDVIASADTLVYFGDLAAVAAAAAAALRFDGVFAFTVERGGDDLPAQGFRLQENGRYQHRAEYVRSVLEAAGLTVKKCSEVILRKERNEPVLGLLVVARAA
jgi:predicted TPR repeat methyltransferase